MKQLIILLCNESAICITATICTAIALVCIIGMILIWNYKKTALKKTEQERIDKHNWEIEDKERQRKWEIEDKERQRKWELEDKERQRKWDKEDKAEKAKEEQTKTQNQ